MNNLPEIRDIYIPDGVSFFPLAYGWWVIFVSIVLFFVILKFLFWGIRTSRKFYALKQLKQIDTKSPVAAAIEMSELLRRICAFKYKEASALYGEKWIDFLNEHTSHKISSSTADLLVSAPFMKQSEDNIQNVETAEKLKEFCKIWIGANL